MENLQHSTTILVVEDEETQLNNLRYLLEDEGYTVLAARDGLQAVQMFRCYKDRIAAVLSDIMLPEMDGWKAFSLMKMDRPELKAIFISAREDLLNSLGYGHNRLIHKPFVIEDLLFKLRHLLSDDKTH